MNHHHAAPSGDCVANYTVSDIQRADAFLARSSIIFGALAALVVLLFCVAAIAGRTALDDLMMVKMFTVICAAAILPVGFGK